MRSVNSGPSAGDLAPIEVLKASLVQHVTFVE